MQMKTVVIKINILRQINKPKGNGGLAGLENEERL